MRLGILYTQIRGDEKLLINACETRGIDYTLIDVREEIFNPTTYRKDFDVALERCVPSTKGLYAVKFLEEMNIPVVNSYDTCIACIDKFNTSLILSRHNIPTVPFGMAFDEATSKTLISQLGGYPVVMKPAMGSWGRMLSKLNDDDALEGVLEQKVFLGGPQHQAFYIQKFIEKGGRDIRTFVVDGKTIAAIYRNSPHWITNTARGGKAENCPVTQELTTLGANVSKALGGGILSIDIFESDTGLLVNEVNHTTEFKNSEAPTGVDISGKIIEYCMSVVDTVGGKVLKVSIVGASGYAGGELLRLLSRHPEVQITQATSQKYAGWKVSTVHPNLRGTCDVLFTPLEQLTECDVLFLCLPNGESMGRMRHFMNLAPKIIDTGADFRLNNLTTFNTWYGEHRDAELLGKFTYGIAELHREQLKTANYAACAGCEATASILALYPLVSEGVLDPNRPLVLDAKMGSSAAGSSPSLGTHHPERSGSVRTFKATMHRHTAEIEQELSLNSSNVLITATSIEMVRGILVTGHVFLKEKMEEKDIWKIYRKHYGSEPFIRIIKELKGIYRYPEPKVVSGTNYCDLGFELDERENRLVVLSAIDNLVKGTSGQAIQAFNIMHGFDERMSLDFMGLHPS